MRRALPIAFILFAVAFGLRGQEPYRAWSDSAGRFTVEAKLLGSQNGTVQLETAAGKTLEIPLDKLSDDDQAYLAERQQVIEGEVVSVTDGDTVTVLDAEKTQHKIRLEGIDAPESHQDYGTQAKKALSDLVFGKSVRVEWKERDRYGRILGHIYVGETWVNKELVTGGAAWHFKKYNKDETLAGAEVEAREAKRGLWAGNLQIPPWDYRNGVRSQPAAPTVAAPIYKPPQVNPSPGAGSGTVYVTETGGKYHRAGCRHLSKSAIPISRSAASGRYGACSVCKP